MNLPAVIFIVRCLVRDTFRQALASGIFWLMLGISVLCMLVCLSVRVVGDLPLAAAEDEIPEFLTASERQRAAAAIAGMIAGPAGTCPLGLPQPTAIGSPEYRQLEAAQRHHVPVVKGELALAFGAIPIPITRDREQAVRFLQLQLAGWVADAAGLLLALVWTAGFLPTFLEPSAASVLLAKPVPRWTLLAGKYLGVLAFVGFQVTLFIGGTWLALGVRTGVWDGHYFLCIPLLVLHFAIFFSFSVLLAVTTRSTVACVFGSVVFWLLCWGMNYGRHVLVFWPNLHVDSAAFSAIVETGYWILPKPADMGAVLFYGLQADNYFAGMLDFKRLQDQGAFLPGMSILSSLVTTVVLLAVAGWEFVTTDY